MIIESPWQAFALVFKTKGYFISALIPAGLIFVISIFIPYLSLIKWTFFFSGFSWLGKFSMLWSLMRSSVTLNSTAVSLLTVASISFLSGTNISLIVFYFKHKPKLSASVGVNLVAWLSGFLGIGCTACGAIILASFLGLSTATLFVGLLPLRGLEFGILAILLLILSISLLSWQIQKQNICKVN